MRDHSRRHSRRTRRIADAVYQSPLARSESNSSQVDAPLYLKLENLQMTGSFKERGALNRLLALSDAERAVGIVASSAGNHAQAVAYIARRLDIRATIIMPEAYDVACSIQQERGLVFIHPYDGDLVIAGQGTIGLELLEQEPALEVIVVPVGGGGLIACIGIAVKDLSPRVEIIGVEAASYPTAQARWRRDSSMPAGTPRPLPTASPCAASATCPSPTCSVSSIESLRFPRRRSPRASSPSQSRRKPSPRGPVPWRWPPSSSTASTCAAAVSPESCPGGTSTSTRCRRSSNAA